MLIDFPWIVSSCVVDTSPKSMFDWLLCSEERTRDNTKLLGDGIVVVGGHGSSLVVEWAGGQEGRRVGGLLDRRVGGWVRGWTAGVLGG